MDRSPWREIDRLLSGPPASYVFCRSRPVLHGAHPMRAVAVAGDLGVDPTHTNIFGWLAGLATATIGAVGLWLAQRVLGKAAFQTAMNDGFSKLTDQLQEERNALRVELETERKAWINERNGWAAEKVAWNAEKAMLVGYIRSLMQTVQTLERRLGVEPSTLPIDIPGEPGAMMIPPKDPG